MGQQQNDENAEFSLASTGHNLGYFKLAPLKPAAWDLLLWELGLTDSQVLKAIELDGEAGKKIRKFVSGAYRQYFVPETVIKAIYNRKLGNLVTPIAVQSIAEIANASAMTSEQW